MALPDYSQYFTDDFNKGPIIDPKLDFRPRKAYYLQSQKDVSKYLRDNTYKNKTKPVPEPHFDIDQKIAVKLKENSSFRIPIQEESFPKMQADMADYINFKPYFWFLLACLTLLPLINSALCNIINLTQNVSSNLELFKERQMLRNDNQELINKLQEYHSYSGMKRTIKEEIKVIEKNEILIKITK